MCSSARAKEELSIKPVEAPNAAIAMYNCVVVSTKMRTNVETEMRKAPSTKHRRLPNRRENPKTL